jgi:putative sigma-54 modulation protein
MQIEVVSQGFTVTEALREYAHRRLRAALAQLGGHIRRVSVRLYDVNGPRGGVDKGCRIQVTLRQRGPVVVDHMEDDLYAAIDRAADRCGRAAARRVERQRARGPGERGVGLAG